MGQHQHVVVIGGGAVGLSSAWFLMRAGHEVTVIDRGRREGPSCSTGNAGLVVPSHFTPLAAPGMISMGLKWMFNAESPFAFHWRADPALLGWVWRFYQASSRRRCEAAMPILRDLSFRSRELFTRLADETELDFGLESKGLLMLCRTAAGLDEEGEAVEKARSLGVEAKMLSPREAGAMEPDVTMDIEGAAFFPQDSHLDPAKFRECLIRALEEGGAVFHWETEVDELKAKTDRVEAVRGRNAGGEPVEVRAGEVVIAGGVWSSKITRMLGVNLPLEAGKGYSMTLDDPPQRPSICALLKEARIAVTPLGGGARFGGTMEIGARDDDVKDRRVKGIVKNIPAYYPEFSPDDFAGEPVWSGLRPCSPDGLPYLGRLRNWRNVTAASGHAMLGLSLAPVTGELVSRIVDGEDPELDLHLLDPARYS